MEPVRVKVYGLFALTKRRYVTVQVIGACVLLGLVAVWYSVPALRQAATDEGPRSAAQGAGERIPLSDPNPVLRGLRWLWEYLPWVVLATFLLEGVETLIVLRRFAHQEFLQRSQLPLPPPT